MIDIRELTPDDWQVWRELRQAALVDAPEAFRASPSHWIGGPGDVERNWRERLISRPLNVALLRDDKPAGMVSAADPHQTGAVELHSLWIAPDARGHALGDAAVRHVLEWAAREHPGAPVELSVKADNEIAMDLYRRHGFADAGRSTDHPDERLMRRAAER